MKELTIHVCVFVLSLWTRVVIAKNSNFYQLRILHLNKRTTFQPENTYMSTNTPNHLNNHRKNTYRTVEETTLSITPVSDNLQKHDVGNKLAIFNKKCQEHEQCGWMEDKDSALQCLSGLCSCPSGYVFVKWPYNKVGCYRKAVLFGNCEVNEQCKTPHTSCSMRGTCLCNFGYSFLYGEGCVKRLSVHGLTAVNKTTKDPTVL